MEQVRDENGLEWSGRASWRRGNLRTMLKMRGFSQNKEREERHFQEVEKHEQKKGDAHSPVLGELSQCPWLHGK